jgi:hypothetical protein
MTPLSSELTIRGELTIQVRRTIDRNLLPAVANPDTTAYVAAIAAGGIQHIPRV